MRRISGGKTLCLSVCLFSVFAARLPATCERIHTVSLSSRQVEKNGHFDEGVDPTDSVRTGETAPRVSTKCVAGFLSYYIHYFITNVVLHSSIYTDFTLELQQSV